MFRHINHFCIWLQSWSDQLSQLQQYEITYKHYEQMQKVSQVETRNINQNMKNLSSKANIWLKDTWSIFLKQFSQQQLVLNILVWSQFVGGWFEVISDEGGESSSRGVEAVFT